MDTNKISYVMFDSEPVSTYAWDYETREFVARDGSRICLREEFVMATGKVFAIEYFDLTINYDEAYRTSLIYG